MSTKPSTRKRLTAEERRAEILGAALAVFGERGYHSSSIDDIARAAGISKALIYEHFDSKEALHLSLLESHARELVERLAASAGGREAGPPRLEGGIEAFFRFVEERSGAWRMLVRDAADPQVATGLNEIVAQVTALVATLIEEDPTVSGSLGKAQRRRTAEMLAQMIVGAMQSLANWWSDQQDVPREHVVELAMDFAWLGLERLRDGERWTPSGPR
jgi:AcrR family transcriptional regulator